MNQREPNLVHSGLSRMVTKDGVNVEVSIVRLENETSWSLEVVNSSGTSIVWDDLFPSDEEAYAEFERTVAEEGIRTFLDGGRVIPLRRREQYQYAIAGLLSSAQRILCLPRRKRQARFLMDYPSGLFSSSRVIRVEMAVTIFNDLRFFGPYSFKSYFLVSCTN